MAKFSSSIQLFSQKTVCEINYKRKSRGDFFQWGVIMTPPLDLQGLNVQVVSNAKFCVDSKNTTQNVLRQKLTSQPQFLWTHVREPFYGIYSHIWNTLKYIFMHFMTLGSIFWYQVMRLREESKTYGGGPEDFRFSRVQILDPPFESREES